jgi:hypothetical protein
VSAIWFVLSFGVRSAVPILRRVGVQFDLVLLIAVNDGKEFLNGLPRQRFQLGFGAVITLNEGLALEIIAAR